MLKVIQALDLQQIRQLQRSGVMLVTTQSDAGWIPLAVQLPTVPTSVISRRLVASCTDHRLEPSGCARPIQWTLDRIMQGQPHNQGVLEVGVMTVELSSELIPRF